MKLLKKLIIILVSILLILIFILSPLVGAQTPPGTALTVEGQLVNATSGEPGKAGIPLMLHTYDGRQMSGMIDGVTGPEGTFRFEDVEGVEGRTFEVMATVGQTTFFSERAAVASEQTTVELPVTIYDTTTNAEAIRIEQMHIMVDFFNPILLQISEIYIISNDGNRIVEGAVPLDDGQTAALSFTLPDGATDLSFEGGQLGERFVQTANGFADTFGVRPGPETSQFLVRYYLPYQDGININRSLPYPIDQSSAIVPQMGVSLVSDDLTPAGSRQIQDGGTVDIFVIDDIQAGQSFSFELQGQPKTNVISTSPESSTQPAPPLVTDQKPLFVGLGLAVLGVALIGGGIWWWRRQTASLLSISSPISAAVSELSETDLIWAMAELDEEYEGGTVSEEAYTHQRGVLRARLKALLTDNHQTEFGETVEFPDPEGEAVAVGVNET